jgi:PadR family transcriptional regulator, regulatory protein PadR
MEIRVTAQTVEVLNAFLHEPEGWKYGYDLSRGTRLKSGTLYPILMRLAERGLLEAEWESGEPGKPPRHMYRLTSEGMEFARGFRFRNGNVRRARLSGVSTLAGVAGLRGAAMRGGENY